MAHTLSRRVFLQGTGVAALAACASLLTACDSGRTVSQNAASFGPVRVDISKRLGTNHHGSNLSETSVWYITPTVYFDLTSDGNWKGNYSSLFTASINGEALELADSSKYGVEDSSQNGSIELSAGIFGMGAVTSATAQPTFAVTEAQFEALKYDGAELVLRVEPYTGQFVTYHIAWDGTITKA